MNAIMLFMWKILVRELLILIVSVAALPAFLILYLIYTDSWNVGLVFLSRQMFAGGMDLAGTPMTLWFKLLSPYLVVQSIRALFWSRKSVTGTKWANLYFALLLASLGGWSLWQALDLLFLMYILGDVPRELPQFFSLEAHNLLIFAGALFFAINCFRTFLNPNRHRPQSHSDD
ncbi:MAG TPA: hypothetical protein VMC85_01405 [Desulfomonilaceae bacterium]|nr:hypothetical protein [Desulfomonilaceae bacterium]